MQARSTPQAILTTQIVASKTDTSHEAPGPPIREDSLLRLAREPTSHCISVCATTGGAAVVREVRWDARAVVHRQHLSAKPLEP